MEGLNGVLVTVIFIEIKFLLKLLVMLEKISPYFSVICSSKQVFVLGTKKKD